MKIENILRSSKRLSGKLHVLTSQELGTLHKLLVEMTNDVALICRENSLAWSLFGGSALGAVRHHGFIPWDDDMDIAMSRVDFERFRKVFAEKLSDKYELRCPGDKNHLYLFPKIYMKGTCARKIVSSKNYEDGISIDILIMENVSENRVYRYLHGIICTAMRQVTSVLRVEVCKINLLKYGAKDQALCKIVKRNCVFAKFFSFLRIEQWLSLSSKIFSICKNETSKHVVIPSAGAGFFGEVFLREKLQTLKAIAFEGEEYFIAFDHDHYLKSRYGENYMVLPTEDKRDIPFYIEFALKRFPKI